MVWDIRIFRISIGFLKMPISRVRNDHAGKAGTFPKGASPMVLPHPRNDDVSLNIIIFTFS